MGSNHLPMRGSEVIISPSVICADFCNLLDDIRKLEETGIHSLHVDLIDGHFSPSMPLGLTVIEQLRNKSSLDFDVHIMAEDNEFFIKELTKIGVQSITFHYESAFHVERMLQLIKAAGSKAGIALNPATPLQVMDYVLEHCDYVLLMLISPGYAGHKGEAMVPYALKKITECKKYIESRGLHTRIVVDGRVSMEVIAEVVAAGADCLVAGSTSFFRKGASLQDNFVQMNKEIQLGLEARNHREDGKHEL
ncbi:hypothetical protein P22_3476 [Propionispora sp. 2/2-37]|uniref:ribulose-phosphate 3-epimerase n=1 Tax=Propionispora sp. 2/2-37 TaxID=1677858 RepID=UPI0006C00761|nr:ribulose-phosphate 3-epimerase [Propionispora sp. 2/2-37]CUH97349.1 hypothetical protein P22_3476 [Propionispora sp. 2/2-37]